MSLIVKVGDVIKFRTRAVAKILEISRDDYKLTLVQDFIELKKGHTWWTDGKWTVDFQGQKINVLNL